MRHEDLYVYRATLVRVIDGDTYDMMIDPGFYLTYAARVRLHNYDTPELYRGSEFEKERAKVAANVVTEWFTEHTGNLYVRTYKADSFGRWLAEPFTILGGNTYSFLVDVLLDNDLATEWPTRWREVYDSDGEAS